MNRIILSIHIFLFYSSVICQLHFDPYMVQNALPSKNVTVIVFMAADNSLADDALPNIEQMAQVGSNRFINVLAYLNIKSAQQPKTTRKLVINHQHILQDGPATVKDSGDPHTVIDALAWAHEKFPADHFVVIFWNHGSGALNRNVMRSVCYDDTTGSFLTDDKVRFALSYILQHYRGGKKFDIIGFDACLMACVEIMYALSDFTQYVVSSQQTIPADGFNYDAVLTPISRGDVDMKKFAEHMVSAYSSEYASQLNDFTLSAVDISMLPHAVENINVVSDLLNRSLYGPDAQLVYDAVTNAIGQGGVIWFQNYIDIIQFFSLLNSQISQQSWHDLYNQSAILKGLNDSITTCTQCVIANTYGSVDNQAHGVSIYCDQNSVDSTYSSLYWSVKNPNWLSFLSDYLSYAN